MFVFSKHLNRLFTAMFGGKCRSCATTRRRRGCFERYEPRVVLSASMGNVDLVVSEASEPWPDEPRFAEFAYESGTGQGSEARGELSRVSMPTDLPQHSFTHYQPNALGGRGAHVMVVIWNSNPPGAHGLFGGGFGSQPLKSTPPPPVASIGDDDEPIRLQVPFPPLPSVSDGANQHAFAGQGENQLANGLWQSFNPLAALDNDVLLTFSAKQTSASSALDNPRDAAFQDYSADWLPLLLGTRRKKPLNSEFDDETESILELEHLKPVDLLGSLESLDKDRVPFQLVEGGEGAINTVLRSLRDLREQQMAPPQANSRPDDSAHSTSDEASFYAVENSPRRDEGDSMQNTEESGMVLLRVTKDGDSLMSSPPSDFLETCGELFDEPAIMELSIGVEQSMDVAIEAAHPVYLPEASTEKLRQTETTEESSNRNEQPSS